MTRECLLATADPDSCLAAVVSDDPRSSPRGGYRGPGEPSEQIPRCLTRGTPSCARSAILHRGGSADWTTMRS
jgi:hypothetical protein